MESSTSKPIIRARFPMRRRRGGFPSGAEHCRTKSFFFCTDRYSWEWFEDVQQLPKQASDSLCLTMDSSIIPDLEQTEVLVLGGCDADSQEIYGVCGSLSNSTLSYDPFLDRFEEKQAMPTERFRAAAVNVSEYVYLFGGRDLNGSLPRGDHVCVALPAALEVFCIGGFTETDYNFTILTSVERFDMETEQWEIKADMVNPRADFGAGLVNGRITVVGGEDDEGMPMDDMEWYDPEEDCWTDSGELFDLPYKRLRYCAATVKADQRIFIFGGQAADEVSDQVYAIKDTVNWYQEILVDQLSPGSAAPSSYPTAAGFAMAIAIEVASACLLAFRSRF
eukprot:jgi/Undpi1/6127/HiC_scaffold_20.g08612.m1